jgi:FdhE protein
MSSAQERWIESHPYLRNVADFQQAVTEVFEKLTPRPVSTPDWKMVLESNHEGVPLLETIPAELEYSSAAGELLLAASAELLKHTLPEPVTGSARSLREYLRADGENPTAAIEWVQNGDPECAPPPAAGLLRVLAWAAMRRTFAPVLHGYAELRKDDAWMRAYCPVCGAPPPLAQLDSEGGKPRMLACCYCRSTWQFRRIECPFCGNEDQNQLAVLTIEQEPLFRLDTCRECNGYLKTYLGNSDLDLHLSDWSSLHLDILARQHNLERKGASLFEI